MAQFGFNPLTNRLDLTSTTGSGEVTSISGNSGAASPSGGNVNVTTSNSTFVFTGSGSTDNLAFSNANSLFGIGTTFPARTTGSFNYVYGDNNAGNAITSGAGNVLLGGLAGSSLTTGSNNIAVGVSALSSLSTGNSCTAVGNNALSACIATGGSENNTAIGALALQSLTTGTANTALGRGAGSSYSGSESGNICIAANGVAAESSTTRIGTAQNRFFASGISGVTVAASAPVGVASGGQLSSLGFGTAGQVFTSNGAATSPTWQAPITSTTQNAAVAQGSAVGLTTATNANVTNISLAAGTWLVTGIVEFGGTPTVTGAQRASISTTSATHGNLGDNSVQAAWLTNSFTAGNCPVTVAGYILTVASTTTTYLVASGVFSGGTMNAYGRISAVRIA